MTTSDDDILDFEFELPDDAAATTESQPRFRRPAPPGGPRPPAGPRFRPPDNAAPLLRLVGLVVGAILLVVFLVLAVQSCGEDPAQGAFEDYSAQIGDVGADSAQIGKELETLLTKPGLKQAELEQQLEGLIGRQQQGVDRAGGLDVPGQAQDANEHALDALAFRVSGMQGLLATFRATKDSKDAQAAGQALAAQAQRLTSSDVVWEDLFRKPTQAIAVAEGVDEVTIPASRFVSNPELYTSRSLTGIWQRVHGASTGGTPAGLHGTGLEGVTVLPGSQALSPSTETTIVVSTDLGFEVAVKNTGDFQEFNVEVTLTIPKQPSPIVRSAKIDLIDPGDVKSVTFKEFPQVPFGEKTTVKVDVKPVPAESNTANNTAEYPVIFSLG